MSARGGGQAAGTEFGEATRAAMPDEYVTRVHLFRHGHVEGFGERLVRGQVDVPLCALGEREHLELIEWARRRGWRPDRILSSDLGRCARLARDLGAAFGCKVELLPELREQHMGEWQGRPWDEISAEHGEAINNYWDDYWHAAVPGGESMQDLSRRCLGWWAEHEAELRGQRLFVVTHAGVIRSLLCHWLNYDTGSALRFAPPVASCTSLLLSAAGAVLEGLGERPASLSESRAAQEFEPGMATQTDRAPLRIAISGSAGTGKTTLGRALAAELGLPFIEERMRLRLESGLLIGSLSVDELRNLNLELWEEHKQLEESYPDGFVADRCSVDFAAFWLHYGFFFDEERTRSFFQEMIDWSTRYTKVLLLPHGAIPLVSDGVRATNPWQQLRFQLLVEGLLEKQLAAKQLLRMPPIDGIEARVSEALKSIVPQATRGA